MRSIPLNERIALIIAQKTLKIVFNHQCNPLLQIAWVHSDMEKRVRFRKCTTQNFYLRTDNPALKNEYIVRISMDYRHDSISNAEKQWAGLAELLVDGNLAMAGEWELFEDKNGYSPVQIQNFQALNTWLAEHFEEESIWRELGIQPVDSFKNNTQTEKQ